MHQLSRRSLLAGLLATAVTPMRLPGREVSDKIGLAYLAFEDIPLERFADRPIGIALNSAVAGQLVEVSLVDFPRHPPCEITMLKRHG